MVSPCPHLNQHYSFFLLGSGDLLSENFNPVMYLLENHCSTTFSQLKDGLDNLRKEVDQSQQAPGEFIKDNLDSFIQCFDTLSDILSYSKGWEWEFEGENYTVVIVAQGFHHKQTLKSLYNVHVHM